MKETEIIPILVFALVVIAFIASFDERLIASETPQKAQKELTQTPKITMLNEVQSNNLGPVIIQKETVGSSWFYDITVTPKIMLVGAESVTAIPFIEFKGQTTRAIVKGPNGNQDAFTIVPDETKDIIVSGQITTGAPPITAFQPFSGMLEEGAPILVKSDVSSVMVSMRTDKTYPIIQGELELPVCHALFDIWGGDCTTQIIDLKGCSTGVQSDCQQSADVCSGTATVQIYGEPDCTTKSVRADISYTGGKEWTPGETVRVSFWKDNSCTRAGTDFWQMLATCHDADNRTDSLGRFTLNAGILPD